MTHAAPVADSLCDGSDASRVCLSASRYKLCKCLLAGNTVIEVSYMKSIPKKYTKRTECPSVTKPYLGNNDAI